MSKRKPGYIKIGAFKKTPVHMHWSFPLGGIFVALFFRSKHDELIFVCIAYAVLIVSHELGHAVSARIFDMKVSSIELSGIGGICHADVPTSRLAAFIYAAAGLLVQAILLIATGIYVHYYGWPSTIAGKSFAFVFTTLNGLLIALNLIPEKVRRESYGTDGYILWKLIIQLVRQRPYAYPDTSATFSPKESLISLASFVPNGFVVGIEIHNDNTTTMEFVVDTLTKNLQFPREKAIEMMLAIHDKGGLLIPLDTYEHAQEVSSAICDEAKREGYKLVCRPVNAQQVLPADAKSSAADG